MILIDGKKEAALLREELKKEVSELKAKYNKVPGLTVILIGDLTPSQIYVRNKEKSANEVGLKSDVIKYPDSVEEKVILEKIEKLNKDVSVSGILVQLPLPKHIDKQKIIEAIDPSKDVDGFHPMNVGNLSSGYESSVPCTPLGCYLLIKKIEPNLDGKKAVIVGRSNLNGKPMTQLLLKENPPWKTCQVRVNRLLYRVKSLCIQVQSRPRRAYSSLHPLHFQLMVQLVKTTQLPLLLLNTITK